MVLSRHTSVPRVTDKLLFVDDFPGLTAVPREGDLCNFRCLASLSETFNIQWKKLIGFDGLCKAPSHHFGPQNRVWLLARQGAKLVLRLYRRNIITA
jgi:hypothetical protein